MGSNLSFRTIEKNRAVIDSKLPQKDIVIKHDRSLSKISEEVELSHDTGDEFKEKDSKGQLESIEQDSSVICFEQPPAVKEAFY